MDHHDHRATFPITLNREAPLSPLKCPLRENLGRGSLADMDGRFMKSVANHFSQQP
jgi:hypothetical protein